MLEIRRELPVLVDDRGRRGYAGNGQALALYVRGGYPIARFPLDAEHVGFARVVDPWPYPWADVRTHVRWLPTLLHVPPGVSVRRGLAYGKVR